MHSLDSSNESNYSKGLRVTDLLEPPRRKSNSDAGPINLDKVQRRVNCTYCKSIEVLQLSPPNPGVHPNASRWRHLFGARFTSSIDTGSRFKLFAHVHVFM